MRTQWSLGIRETVDLKGDSRIMNEESVELSVYIKIAEEREYMEDL